MPIFTRRSRASTAQITSARMSKNGPMVTFASDTSLLRHTSTSWYGWLRSWVSCRTALVSLRTQTFFFPLVTDTFSSNAEPRILIQFSHAWCQSFAIEVSDLYSASPLFSTLDSLEPMSYDESPCRKITIHFWFVQTPVSSIFTDFPRYHRTESLT